MFFLSLGQYYTGTYLILPAKNREICKVIKIVKTKGVTIIINRFYIKLYFSYGIFNNSHYNITHNIYIMYIISIIL